MQAEPSNFLLESDAIVAACRKREGEGLSSNDTVGRGGEGRLSYSALEGGVGRTLQLYLARAASAAAAAPRCQPVTPSVHRARNKQESGCIYRALPAKHPYQLPPFNSPSRKTTPKIGTNTKASVVVCLYVWRCNAWLCGRIYVCPLPLLLRWKQAATREPTRVKTRTHPQSTAKLFFLDCWCNVAF